MNAYVHKILDGFYRRDRREQIILLVGGVCLVLYFIWFVLLQSLDQARQEQWQNNQSVSAALMRVQTMAAQLQKAAEERGGSSRKSSGSIADLVDRTVRANGLQMKGFQPGSDGEARLRFEAVTFENLMQWLYDLEITHGVQVLELSATATNKPGLVMVNVRLRKG